MNRTSCMNYNTPSQPCGMRGSGRPGMMMPGGKTTAEGVCRPGQMMPAGGKTGAEGVCRPGQMMRAPENECGLEERTGQMRPVPGNGQRLDSCPGQMRQEPERERRMGSMTQEKASGIAAPDCGCADQMEIPTGSRSQLLNYINEVSFAAYDAMLFLDTHPTDPEALAYFQKHSRMRMAALKEYERRYGPLTLDTAGDSISSSFAWSQQPWPWEGGAC